MNSTPRMISGGRGGAIWPPMGAVLGAVRRARVQGVKIYLFGTETGWQMTTGLDKVPSDSAVWEFPANSNEPRAGGAGA
jgi:hypothetical protein